MVSHFTGPNSVWFSVCLLYEQQNAFVQSQAIHIISWRARLICLPPLHFQGAVSLQLCGKFFTCFCSLCVVFVFSSLAVVTPLQHLGQRCLGILLLFPVQTSLVAQDILPQIDISPLNLLSEPGTSPVVPCQLGFTSICFSITAWQWMLALSVSWGSEAILAISIS